MAAVVVCSIGLGKAIVCVYVNSVHVAVLVMIRKTPSASNRGQGLETFPITGCALLSQLLSQLLSDCRQKTLSSD